MAASLHQYFPMIRGREEVLTEIGNSDSLSNIFNGWSLDKQEAFLDFSTGVRGLKPLIDQFFKTIVDPEIVPERLEEILSELLQMKVKILKVLPNDSPRITAEYSLLVMDVVVQLEDNSIANVELQRIGYDFPGQRSACYSADLLLRQYRRIRSEKGEKFTYRDVKKVYTIILFEKSVKEFHKFPDDYIHYMKQQSNTGLQIDLLQEYVFIALDIFKNKLHNKGDVTENRLEAWLTFFCEDDPEWILKLINAHPDFARLYKEVYSMCRNMEWIMGLFSEELAILDKNTVLYMIDELQNTVDSLQDTANTLQGTIKDQQSTIKDQQSTINDQQSTINDQQSTIDDQKSTIDDQKSTIDDQKSTIDDQKSTIDNQKAQLSQKDAVIAALQKQLAELNQ